MGETLVYAIKTAIIVVASAAFLAAIVAICATIINFASNSFLGELIGYISIWLPFNPATVFSAIVAAFDVIITFVVARKIYEIIMKSNEAN